MSAVEIEVHRANTDAWVAARPITVALTREDEVATPGGGYEREDRVLPPQTFRIDSSSNQSAQFLTLPSGFSVPERFRLVGPTTLDVQDGDRFTVEGRRFDVTHVHMISYERVAAEVEYRG